VPSLILQPLVENAVVHGLAGHEGAVTIRVEATVSGETLTLRVLNTIAPGRGTGAAGSDWRTCASAGGAIRRAGDVCGGPH